MERLCGVCRATSLAVVLTLVGILPLTPPLTLNNTLDLSDLLFPHLERGNKNSHLPELSWV